MTSITSIVNARRLDRVLPWIGAAVLAAGVATFLVVYFGRSDSSSKPAPTVQAAPKKQTPVPLPTDARHAAIAFLRTAVSRKNLAASYDMATPTLRQGMSKREWVKGNIPIPYYPTSPGSLKNAGYTVDYSYPRDVQIELSVGAPKGVKMASVTFLVGLIKRNGRWLVDYWGTQNQVPVPNVPG